MTTMFLSTTRKITMKKITLALVGALATVASACYASAPPPQVQTVTSADAQEHHYDTFAFGWTANPPAQYAASARSLEVDHRLRDLVSSALRQKGYVEDNSRPSMLVRIGSGVQQVRGNSTEEADPLGASREDVLTFEGTKIAIYDADTKTEVWQGTASSLIDPTKGIDNSVLQREVQDAIATFPVRSVGPNASAPAPVAVNEASARGK